MLFVVAFINVTTEVHKDALLYSARVEPVPQVPNWYRLIFAAQSPTLLSNDRVGASVPTKPKPSAKNVPGDFDNFTNFARQIMSVPHSEIKAQIDAEKAAKRTPKSASRVSGDESRRS